MAAFPSRYSCESHIRMMDTSCSDDTEVQEVSVTKCSTPHEPVPTLLVDNDKAEKTDEPTSADSESKSKDTDDQDVVTLDDSLEEDVTILTPPDVSKKEEPKEKLDVKEPIEVNDKTNGMEVDTPTETGTKDTRDGRRKRKSAT